MWEVNVLITLFEWNILLNMGKGLCTNCHNLEAHISLQCRYTFITQSLS